MTPDHDGDVLDVMGRAYLRLTARLEALEPLIPDR
jgi:hypothetical protein